MIFKKLVWIVKRHPFLYLTRFKLLSKNSSVKEIEGCSYNDINTKEDIPKYFYDINDIIFKYGKPNNDFELIKKLSIWLNDHIKGGPGLSEPSYRALKIMLEGKGGVCSDMAQIFNNFCVINDIKVREWGTTRAPFHKGFGGHSFNEVYCKELESWVLIDVYNCLLFFNSGNKPLSVIEFFRKVRANVHVDYSVFYEVKKIDEDGVYRNFLEPHTVPFLICNYSNKTYDKYLSSIGKYLPIFMVHFILYMFNKSYHYKFPVNDYKTIFS